MVWIYKTQDEGKQDKKHNTEKKKEKKTQTDHRILKIFAKWTPPKKQQKKPGEPKWSQRVSSTLIPSQLKMYTTSILMKQLFK